MRPGVVWFGEQLPWNELQRVEDLSRSRSLRRCDRRRNDCDVWLHHRLGAPGAADGGELIEVNPEETPLSRFATRLVREPAAVALPRIVDELINRDCRAVEAGVPPAFPSEAADTAASTVWIDR